ncbi:hypothetical protein [Burkholderia territorii]|uniref:hypothetical protein n=1 Tax=Burkholderia territorii TaxID=1503055 RepID=UPI0020121AE9|nr:hypothetical protein [Burkholderia territorii]
MSGFDTNRLSSMRAVSRIVLTTACGDVGPAWTMPVNAMHPAAAMMHLPIFILYSVFRPSFLKSEHRSLPARFELGIPSIPFVRDISLSRNSNAISPWNTLFAIACEIDNAFALLAPG